MSDPVMREFRAILEENNSLPSCVLDFKLAMATAEYIIIPLKNNNVIKQTMAEGNTVLNNGNFYSNILLESTFLFDAATLSLVPFWLLEWMFPLT